jgi:hypothetical protein
MKNSNFISHGLLRLAFALLIGGCARYGPYHVNTATDPMRSVRGPADGRYKMAIIEFNDQGSAIDTWQRTAAINVLRKEKRPLLFVYIHGWQNDAASGDVCRFEHFLDTASDIPEVASAKTNVVGVYIAWRGKNLTVPGLNMLTFWSRKSAGGEVAAQNSCLAVISELALAARTGKKAHHCVLMGHSFGGLVLANTISHSILGASSAGTRNSSPWDMAVAFNSADNSISTRQLMSELDYLYKYDPARHAYVGRVEGVDRSSAAAINENQPLFVILQSENDSATGQFFPIGTGMSNALNLRFHWDKVPVPGGHGEKVSENEFNTHTPGNNKYLVNFKVVPLGPAAPPPGLKATANKAFEANMRQNLTGRAFYTSEKNDGHEAKYCRGSAYDPGEKRPETGKEVWRRWEFVPTGTARVPCWIVRVPKDIIWGHGGLWSDNSVAMLGALYRLHFPFDASGRAVPTERRSAPSAPDTEHMHKDRHHAQQGGPGSAEPQVAHAVQ